MCQQDLSKQLIMFIDYVASQAFSAASHYDVKL